MTQYGFYFDSARCTGCKSCEISCKDYNDLGADILFRRVYDMETGTWSQSPTGAWTTTSLVYHVSNSCNHCDDPACVANCPTGAMQKNPETGLVYADPETCIGCGTCVQSCPYDAPRIDAQLNLSRKCDGCSARVAEGKLPICVKGCPNRALDFGPVDDLRKRYGQLADMGPLPDSDITHPNLVMKANASAAAAGAETFQLANELEVQ